MRYYSKRHYALVSPPKDTAANILDRKIMRAALDQAQKDLEEKFPVISIEHAQEILDYQQERQRYHLDRMRKNQGNQPTTNK